MAKNARRSLSRLVAGGLALLAATFAAPDARAGDVHYSLLLGTPLNDQTYRNSAHADYYSVVTSKKFSKFEYLVIPAPSCTNFQFPEFVTLATKLAAANRSGMKLIFYTRPVGNEPWQTFLLSSGGCTGYGATPWAYYSTLMKSTGIAIPAADIESLHFPTGLDVGTGLLSYLSTLAFNAQPSNPLWVANTAYAEKFLPTTGQFFTTDASGHLTGNTTLPPSLISQLGTVIWMDFHTMYAEHSPGARAFVDQRLLDVATITGAKTSVQIGLTCLNGKVDLKGNSDQETMSTAVAQGETVMIDAFSLAGIRNFNVYVALANLQSPQWASFYKLMSTSSAKFPTSPNVSWATPNKNGIAYGLGCLQE